MRVGSPNVRPCAGLGLWVERKPLQDPLTQDSMNTYKHPVGWLSVFPFHRGGN